MHGFVGDSLASALLANGIRLIARSFKYHRPRGIFSAGVEEPNCLVQLETGHDTIPNISATQIELYDGLNATSQHRWPSLRFDLGAISNVFGRFIPAGFYYKTFMWPGWDTYKGLVRRSAGLGRAPAEPDQDCYDQVYKYVDVAVVGGGIAGLASACSAARTGARVLLVEQDFRLGGIAVDDCTDDFEIDEQDLQEWVSAAVRELDSYDSVQILTRSTVFGYYEHNFLGIVERLTDHIPRSNRTQATPRQRLWKIRAGKVILATGAHERPLVFAGNDTPGVMLASAVNTYLRRYAVVPGRRVVIFTNNDSAYRTGIALVRCAAANVTIVDLREELSGDLPAMARKSGIGTLPGSAIVDVKGRRSVSGVYVQPLTEDGRGLCGPRRKIACDLICISGGFQPVVHLFSQSGGKLNFAINTGSFLPGKANQAVVCVGECRGTTDIRTSVAEGWAEGLAAAGASGFTTGNSQAPRVTSKESAQQALRPIWKVPASHPHQDGHTHFIDLQNDVTARDLALAVREGYESNELAKRYTTFGMGPDQGKTANTNAIAVLAELRGSPLSSNVTTTFRPPYTPVTLGVFAGRHSNDLVDPV